MELVFRKIKESDLKTLMTWRTNPEVSKYMYTDFEPSMERQREWFKGISGDPTRKDWIIQADGEDVGLLGLSRIDPVNRRCDWAYYLGSPNVRGKGIGKSVELNVHEYVFETLGLNKLCCEVFVSNKLVINIHEKYGSVVEGRRVGHIYKGGEFHDIVEMSLLRDNWEKDVKGKFEFVKGRFEEVPKGGTGGESDV